jgi:hypothetical protein
MVDPSPSSKRPICRDSAPVYAPRSRPNSSLSMSAVGIAAQFTRTIVFLCRGLKSWMTWAKTSLPDPVSPSIRTVAGVGATCSTCASTCRAAALSAATSLGA